MTLVVSTTLKQKTPLSSRTGVSLYTKAADFILGKKFEVSLVFVGDKRSHALNFSYRGKDKPTNVLSFPLSKESGEIIIALPYARREAKDFDATPDDHILYLFIHGCCHLKGLDHGTAMDRLEQKTLAHLGKKHT